MAARRLSKAGRTKSAGAPASSGTVARLTLERDRLAAELEMAQRRIAELEAVHAETVDRIDWAIDSLHSLVESWAVSR